MARKYSKKAQSKVKSALHKKKRGTLKKGKGGKGGKVTSRKQAIAIGLSEARKSGAKVPDKPSKKKSTRKKTATSKKTKSKTKKTSSKKRAKKSSKKAG